MNSILVFIYTSAARCMHTFYIENWNCCSCCNERERNKNHVHRIHGLYFSNSKYSIHDSHISSLHIPSSLFTRVLRYMQYMLECGVKKKCAHFDATNSFVTPFTHRIINLDWKPSEVQNGRMRETNCGGDDGGAGAAHGWDDGGGYGGGEQQRNTITFTGAVVRYTVTRLQ